MNLISKYIDLMVEEAEDVEDIINAVTSFLFGGLVIGSLARNFTKGMTSDGFDVIFNELGIRKRLSKMMKKLSRSPEVRKSAKKLMARDIEISHLNQKQREMVEEFSELAKSQLDDDDIKFFDRYKDKFLKKVKTGTAKVDSGGEE